MLPPLAHVGSEGRRGRWGTPTMTLQIRICGAMVGVPYHPLPSSLPTRVYNQDHRKERFRIFGEKCPFGSWRSPQRALPTETKVESGTSQKWTLSSVK